MVSSNNLKPFSMKRCATNTCKVICIVPFSLIFCLAACLVCKCSILFDNPCQRIRRRFWKRRANPQSDLAQVAHRRYGDQEARRDSYHFEHRNSLSIGSTSAKYEQQSKSVLFQRLPLELRQKIYAFVLNDETFVHLVASADRFVIPGCANEKCPSNPCRFCLEDEEKETVLRHTRCILNKRASGRYPSPLQFLPLLLSCRRIYTEAINLLYTEKTFILESTFHFPAWACSIPDRHLSLVRSLVLHLEESKIDITHDSDDWAKTLSVLARMPRLRRCRIIVHGWYQKNKTSSFLESFKVLDSKAAFVVDFVDKLWETETRFAYHVYDSVVVN